MIIRKEWYKCYCVYNEFLFRILIFEDSYLFLLTYGILNNTDVICEKDKVQATPHIILTYNEVYKKMVLEVLKIVFH